MITQTSRRALALCGALTIPAGVAAAQGERAAPPVLATGAVRPMPAEWIDSATGHRVVRLSRREGSNSSFYFHNDPFVPDTAGGGARMVFYGSTPAGRQLFTVDLRTLEVRQLTAHAGGVSGEIVARRRREVIYQRRDSVFATHVDTRATRLLHVLPAALRGSVTTLNADETLLAGVGAGPELREILRQYPAKSQFFDRIFQARIPHALFTVDLRTGALRTVHREDTWLGHVQFSPTDPHRLMFCHEGPWHLVDRIWTVDVRTGEVRKVHERTVEREIAGHEFWSPDGRTIWYDLQVPRGVTFYLAGRDVQTGRATRYQLTRDEWSIHFNSSPDGTLFAGDGGDSTQVARARDGRWLYLFRPRGDRLVSERLVDMRRHDYRALEPDVHFSPDGRWVIFRATFEGENQVYAVEVARSRAADTPPSPQAMPLWPGGAPGARGSAPEDTPAITPFLAPADRATGAAVVVFPGGGYQHLATEKEGNVVARWLNSLGVSAFVVRYRLGPTYRHPAMLHDAQRAVRLVRARAAAWGVDPARIGVLGFSAGGHLASTAGTRFDAGTPSGDDPVERASSRPDLMVLVYPVITMDARVTHQGSRRNLIGEHPAPELVRLMSNEAQVTRETPPTFLVASTDDAAVPVENSLRMYQALRSAGVPVELHVFESGRHGWGTAPGDPVLSSWLAQCELWLWRRGWARAPEATR